MEIILLLAALVITWLIFTWLVKVVKASVTTALTVAAIVLALQIGLGIGPGQLWQQLTQFFPNSPDNPPTESAPNE